MQIFNNVYTMFKHSASISYTEYDLKTNKYGLIELIDLFKPKPAISRITSNHLKQFAHYKSILKSLNDIKFRQGLIQIDYLLIVRPVVRSATWSWTYLSNFILQGKLK